MKENKSNINEIRRFFKEAMSEKYAIKNTGLREKDEYIKVLYIKMLATIAQYENDINDMQVVFLKRISKGIACEEPIEEYMRKALEISVIEVQEFIENYKKDINKFYFGLDAIILLLLGSDVEQRRLYVAEILEMLNLSKGELTYLSMLARSILMQDSKVYDEAKAVMVESLKDVNFYEYIKNYYAGAVVDNDFQTIYTAPEKQSVDSLEGECQRFTQRKVVFYGLEINVDGNWEFDGCEEVTFENCTINCVKGKIILSAIGSFVMRECLVENFNDAFIEMSHVNDFQLLTNNIVNCSYTKQGLGDIRGGVIRVINSGKCFSVKLNGNTVQNCYIKATEYKGNYGVTGAFFGVVSGNVDELEVTNNTFIGCKCINNGNYTAAVISTDRVYRTSQDNNIAKGELTRVVD